MTADPASASAFAFASFLPQIVEHLGPIRWLEEPTAHGPNRGFAVLYLCAPASEVGSAVTNGLRFQKITAVFPQELCCTLLADQEAVAHRVVVQVAQMILEAGAGITTGAVIPGHKPFAPGSEMVGVICADHPFAAAEFDTVRTADGNVEMQIITLIPATAAELTLAAQQGTDTLFDVWEAEATDLADIRRASACV